MDKILKLYTYVDGGIGDTPFPNAEGEPIEIGAFRYDAKRMGGAPTITASVNYPSCLDDVWTDNVYAEFNGEKYFLKQTPTSSYDNQDTMYKHDLELVSERVALDNVYFFDVVTGNPQGSDKPVSNSTKVVFFGNIWEFRDRMNASLEYSGLDYRVVVDEDEAITTEEKLMSFEDQFFSNVLQEIYNTFEVPYYFDGKVIHIGYSKEGVVIPDLAYGVDNALLSITKNNANYKIVNRATATGSSDNIPFYYPNTSPKGIIEATSSNANLEVTVIDNELYSNAIELDGEVVRSNVDYENLVVSHLSESIYSGQTFSAQMGAGGISKSFGVSFDAKDAGELSVSFSSNVTKYTLNEEEKDDYTVDVRYYLTLYNPQREKVFTSGRLESVEGVLVPITEVGVGYRLDIETYYAVTGRYAGKGGRISYNASFSFGSDSGWTYNGRPIELKDIGLKVEGNPVIGDTITQKLVEYIKTSQNLLPYVYRKTWGNERFYNAVNGPYRDEEGNVIIFNNPYVQGKPKEHIFTVEDIKPTIKEATNGISWVETDEDGNQKTVFQRVDMFSEFAYDRDDNDETYEDEEGNVYFKHPYFYGKLRVMDFNLFDHAIENQPMTISFTSGNCGACNFEIGVTEEYPQKNPVQVDVNGNLLRDANGMVLAGIEGIQQEVTTFQDRQQDTSKYEVWIALKKEETTYGILMPKAPKFNDAGEQIEAGHRPKAAKNEDGTPNNEGDTFVILGINLPQSYIINAEKKLEAEIIKYLQDNNNEKFTFSIDFSRIYFEENEIHDQLNENSKIAVMYNGKRYELYVSSFSYSMSEGDVLPDIRVELDETLQVSQNALQNAISEVKSELGRVLGSIDVVGVASPFFIRKDSDDVANGTVNFTKGIKFGEGGKVEVMENNSAKLTIEYLEVTKKASFTSLEIKEKTHVGGQIIISPAAMTCGEVEELDSVYRCYFQTKGADGSDEIFNQFAVNDLAICQTYNAWGSRYYWRKVVGVGEDYIDLSKTICDEGSDIPMAGDKIVQLGNTEDTARQAAQVLSAYGEDAPSFVMYNGINDFSLEGKNITGIIWNPETQEPQMYSYGSFFFGDKELDGNYITFQKREGDAEKSLHINARITVGEGSDGLSNLSEWQQAEKDIEDAKSNAQEALDAAQQALADMSWLGEDITEINKRLDGVVENYFYEGAPSIYKSPVTDWLSESLEQGNDNVYFNHIGDTYTDIQTYIDDESTPTAGKSWRWCQCETSGGILATINSGYISSEDWYKIGNIPQGAYYYVRCYIGGYECLTEHFSYDSQILVNGGPPVYLKVESATGDVYVFDQYGYLASQTSRYEFLDQNSQYIEATDKEGNIVKLHWHQIADSDAVKALLEASKAQSTADGKSTTYLSKPTNGYKKGDLWILESDTVHSAGKKGDILTANQNSASYVASHWKKVVRYTDDSALEEFIEGDFKDTIDSINNQIDKKAETWYQTADPSTAWTTAELKKEHTGDMWYDTTDGVTKRWDGTSWQKQDIPDEVFDKIDGKKSIYTSKPSSYSVNDLWILEQAYTLNGVSYTKGELVVANQTSSTFSASHWEKKVKYTDDTTANAAQAKANEVSEKIDGDNYFTEIEKKTIRSIIAEITECREKLHENNAIVKFTTKQGHSWYLVEEDSYAEWTDANEEDHSVSQSKYAGYYSSNLHNANSYSVTQVDVELTEGREVDIQLDYFSDAESTNDWMTVGARGTTVSPANTTTTSNTLPNRAGSTYGKQRMVFSKVYNITQEVDAEKRYFQVAYKKNATIDVGTDSAYFRISNPHYIDESGSLHIIELKGSFHRYYLLLKQKGYTEVADMLYDALTEILGLLNANGLWTSGTTELTDGVTFRATLNEYLTDYYAILASCGFDIMDSKVSDFDYLAGALKDGSKTITEGGLVMTSLVAVGDTSTTNVDVEAFMNGSDFCKDNEHGKLIHAMGIPQTVIEDGTEYTDLEKRSKAAQTRIYEDGTIISQNVILEDGCKVGNLSIKDGVIGVFDGCSETVGVTTYGISIRQKNIQMASYRNNGSTCLLPTITNLSHSGLNVIKTTDDTNTQPAIDINIPEDRMAFSCSKGLVEGLRTNVKAITSAGSTTNRTSITELDFSVLLPTETSAATFYLKLPAAPPLGQEYLIESRGAGMNIVASQKIFNTSSGTTTSASSQFTQSGRCLMRFKYYGSSHGWSATRIDY